MELQGLAGTPLLALGGAVTALTLLLYILKLRRRALVVPFSPIWRQALGNQSKTRLFSEPRRWLSLLLQLLLAWSLVSALADPRLNANTRGGRHILALVDISASMQTTDVSPNRITVAKKQLRDLVEGLAGSDELLLAELGPIPRAVSLMTNDEATLLRAIESIHAQDTGADLERGMQFALDALHGLSNPEIWLVSDGAFQEEALRQSSALLAGVQVRYLPVGTATENNTAMENIGITAFSARRYPFDAAHNEVMLEVKNFGSRPETAEVQLSANGDSIDSSQVELAPGASVTRFFPDLAAPSARLVAKVHALSGADHFTGDDQAYAILPEKRRTRVLLVTPGNTYLEAALLLDTLDLSTVAPSEALPAGTFDITILDRAAPKLGPSHGSALYLSPPEDGSPVKYGKLVSNFGFDTWEKTSPLLRWIAPENIQVEQGQVFALDATRGRSNDVRVVGASEFGPILLSGRFEGRAYVALSFDPRDSDLVLRVAWPLFLQNVLNYFARTSTDYTSTLRTGETWTLALDANGAGARATRLSSPSGRLCVLPADDEHVTWFGTESGFYSLETANGQRVSEFAATLLDATESGQSARASLSFQGASETAPALALGRKPRGELWHYLLAAVLVLSFFEWFTYHRRVTV